MNDLVESVAPIPPRGSLARLYFATLRRRRAFGTLLALAIGFAGGVLFASSRDDSSGSPVGSAHLSDPVDDVFTGFRDLPPLGTAGDGLDLRQVSISSDGRELRLSITTVGQPIPKDRIAGEWRFTFEFFSGERLLYSGDVLVPIKGPPTLRLLDRDLLDANPDPKFRPKINLRESGSVDRNDKTILVRLDLSALPKLPWGMTWSVSAHGFIVRGDLAAPHEDRAPDKGAAVFLGPR